MYIDQYSVDRQMFLDNRQGNELRTGTRTLPSREAESSSGGETQRGDRLWLYSLPAMIGVMLGST